MVLYALTTHRLLLVFVLPLACLALAVLLHRYRGRRWGYFLIPTVFTLALINAFTGPWINAGFLNRFGTPATAVLVDRRDAGWLLNEQRVLVYDALLRTADGQDVVVQFNDTSVSIWPPRNLILLPPLEESFVVKFIPGFVRNFVILSDESDYGKRRLLNEARGPLERARKLHEASPDNARFAQDYRQSLQAFLTAYGPAVSASERQAYEARLAALSAPAP